jgi:lysophospholipase L1-like esterase
MHPRLPLGAIVAALLVALAVPGGAAAKAKPQYYVSLGDSYSVGWERHSETDAGPTTKGYANDIVSLARAKGLHYKLVNFGCGGATTVSILKSKGCDKAERAKDGPKYSSTQLAAAEKFLRKHRGKVGLITVSISGNDVTACARESDPVSCVGAATASIKTNVTKLAKRLRKAGGKKVPIVGLTYPDVILGQWVREPVNQDLAKLSVVAFQQLINPTLKTAYATAKGRFVDVTAATGAYGSLDATTTLAPYGTIPVPVAKICELTAYCQFGDIHANSDGYRKIAKLVVAGLPRAKH